MFDALTYPFMQRALAAGVLVGVMTSLLGVLVVLRRSAFFGDAIAHAALTGVAIGVLTGWNPLFAAVGVGIGIAMSLQVMERRSRLALDTVLGFVLPFFLAVGVLLLSLTPGYQPDLVSFLFGSILTVSRDSLLVIVTITVVVLGFLLRFRHHLIFATFDEDAAQLARHSGGTGADQLLHLTSPGDYCQYPYRRYGARHGTARHSRRHGETAGAFFAANVCAHAAAGDGKRAGWHAGFLLSGPALRTGDCCPGRAHLPGGGGEP